MILRHNWRAKGNGALRTIQAADIKFTTQKELKKRLSEPNVVPPAAGFWNYLA